MYGEQCTIFPPSASHAPKNRTTSTSTSVTSFKSKTNCGPLSWSCFFNSSTCSDWKRPIRRIVVFPPRESFSIFNLHSPPSERRPQRLGQLVCQRNPLKRRGSQLEKL